ncbi:hypothetical protein B0H14DRAFT_2556528 [Mycena olivaceomarginata]|nr:hypothetical protein B0H14DRAFT_2556528 [Mycena olivaceomarginata]
MGNASAQPQNICGPFNFLSDEMLVGFFWVTSFLSQTTASYNPDICRVAPQTIGLYVVTHMFPGYCNETKQPVWGGSTPWRPVPQHPQAYPQLPTHSREVPKIGRGPPPTPSRHGRSVSFESPILDRHHASGNPAFFDAAVTPTPNRINYPPQRAQYGLSTDQLLFTLLRKMDAVLDENRNLVNCVGELTHRVTVLEQGAHAPQAGRRRGPQRGRAIARAPSTRRSVLHHSPSSEESINPVLRGVEALDSTSETTTDTATGSEFSDDVDDRASTAGNDNEGPVVTDEETLTKAEKKAVRLRISQIFRQVCNVFGKEWPDITEVRVSPFTNQQYPTPNFAYDILNIDNCALFRKKSEQIDKVVEAVAEDTRIDVAFLRVSTHPEYLSDEVSGPESDSETPEDWKFRLATLANLRNDPTSLKATQWLNFKKRVM